ncbi:MAG: O-antigen ligase family protein [Prevotella sp.]|nr:O-antigen ligase family protein [Prevotella sp.]
MGTKFGGKIMGVFKTIIVITYIGCLFVTSNLFIGANIQPKWISLFIGIILLSFLYSFSLFGNNHKSYTGNERLMKLILFISFIEVLYGIFHHLLIQNNIIRLSELGSFDNPSGYALCGCSVLPFLLLYYNNTNKRIIMTLITFTIFVIGVIISGSRAGFFSIFIVSLFYFYNSKLKLKCVHIRKNYMIAFLTIFIILGLLIVLYLLKKDSADGRLLIWCAALYMIADAPFFGHGIGAIQKEYMDYQALFMQDKIDSQWAMLADNSKHLFNEYLGILVQFGIVGFLIFIIGSCLIIHTYKKTTSVMSKCAFLSLISIAIFSFFSYPFSYPFIWILFFLDLYVLIGEVYGDYIRNLICKYRMIISFVLMSVFSVLGYIVFTNSISEMKLCQIVKDTTLSGHQRLIQFSKLEDSMNKNPIFLYNYAVEAYMSDEYEQSLLLIEQCRRYWSDYEIELLEAFNYSELQLYHLSDLHYEKAHYMCPNRFEPLYYRAKDYIAQKKLNEAKEIAEIIINKKAKVPSDEINSMKKEMNEYILHYNNFKSL